MLSLDSTLRILAVASLAAAAASALFIVADVLAGRRQKMPIMNLVWPLTAVWSGPIGLWAYLRHGRAPAPGGRPREKSFAVQAAVATSHCGSGCTLGDVVAESLVISWPVTFLGSRVFGTWLLDFVFAFLFGVVFQYFTIAPMKGLGFRDGIVAALKADTLSLTAWQVGMYGWMAVVLFALFSPETLAKSDPIFWFMMQIAMAAGFVTSYPVNRWLLRRGIKEPM